MEAVGAHGDGRGYDEGWQNFYSLRHAQQPTCPDTVCLEPELVTAKILCIRAVVQYGATAFCTGMQSHQCAHLVQVKSYSYSVRCQAHSFCLELCT